MEMLNTSENELLEKMRKLSPSMREYFFNFIYPSLLNQNEISTEVDLIDSLAGKYQGKINNSETFIQNKAIEKSLYQ